LLTRNKNPVDVFKFLVKQKPELQPILNLLENGTSPQQVFIEMCSQRGVDSEQFIKQLQDSFHK
jgi:hypothetical protein